MGEFKLGAEIEVFKIKDWKRKFYLDETSFTFITMSPIKIFGADFLGPFKLVKNLEKIEGKC